MVCIRRYTYHVHRFNTVHKEGRNVPKVWSGRVVSYLSEEDYNAVATAAKKARLALSAYCRSAIMRAVEADSRPISIPGLDGEAET